MRLTGTGQRQRQDLANAKPARLRSATKSAGWAAFISVAVLLTGCGQFFPKDQNSGGGSGGSTGGGDYIYAGNIGSSPVSVAGFSLASAALSVISGSPWEVPLEPTALAVTPDDDYLFVGSAAGGVYVYTIGSNGSLSLGNDGTPVATGLEPAVLRVDPTGKFLIGGDAFAGTVYVYQIGSGGTLTAISSSVVQLNGSDPVEDLAITPNGAYVYASLGTAGIYTMSFNTSTGALAQVNGVLTPKTTNAADYGLAVSPAGNFLFAAETVTGGVRVLSIGTNGVITEVSGSPVKVGTGARSVLVDSTGTYLYVADRTNAEIHAYSISTAGALTELSGSPVATGTQPTQMVEDNSDSYIAVVCAGGSPDLEVFQLSSTTPGALEKLTTATTGTDPTVATSLAATH